MIALIAFLVFLIFISGCTSLFLHFFSNISSGLYSTWVKPQSLLFPKVPRQSLPLVIAPGAHFFSLQMYSKALWALAWAPKYSTTSSLGFVAVNEVAAKLFILKWGQGFQTLSMPHWKRSIFTNLQGGQLENLPHIQKLVFGVDVTFTPKARRSSSGMTLGPDSNHCTVM